MFLSYTASYVFSEDGEYPILSSFFRLVLSPLFTRTIFFKFPLGDMISDFIANQPRSAFSLAQLLCKYPSVAGPGPQLAEQRYNFLWGIAETYNRLRQPSSHLEQS